ncbi:MAG: YggS family pyridoxal phosphate-dependent enzyme [Marinilabiliales bacterium]|nr:YggS family pyridoxal phosphate-dependent enzyme [Marinilabiliales bacterium]
MSISENLIRIKNQLPVDVKLVAVSKTKSQEQIMEAYDAGQRIFGENKVQELIQKHGSLPQDIEWHFIGHLQSNKVRQLIPYVSLIHGVDSFKLLEVLNKEAARVARTVDVLLEFHIAREESKFGLTMETAREWFDSPEFQSMSHVNVCGVMGMATFTEDQQIIKSEFERLHAIFLFLKSHYFANTPSFKEISMGMSDDFLLAIQAGSTLVRIGSSIFGTRQI